MVLNAAGDWLRSLRNENDDAELMDSLMAAVGVDKTNTDITNTSAFATMLLCFAGDGKTVRPGSFKKVVVFCPLDDERSNECVAHQVLVWLFVFICSRALALALALALARVLVLVLVWVLVLVCLICFPPVGVLSRRFV